MNKILFKVSGAMSKDS